MLYEAKSKTTLFARHLAVGFIAGIVVYVFWLLRPELSADARLWRALADAGFIFLSACLVIGPLSRLWDPCLYLIPWRREVGIWFAVLVATHALLVSGYALREPGIELPAILGLIALFWTLVLAATSSDRAVNFLGVSSWKWLHGMANTIFYLVAAHAAYFLFWRYPEENMFQVPFLIMVFAVPILQMSAFAKEVSRQKRNSVDMEVKRVVVSIFEKKIIAEKTHEISFDVSGKDFVFEVGQYVRVSVPELKYSDPKGASRLFSIISFPENKTKISVAFRDSESGFKKTLTELPLGSFVTLEGPFGYFTLPEDTSVPIVFVAGGIGITPLLSMIRFVAHEKISCQITLLYANKSEESAAYLRELEKIDDQESCFVLKNTFDRLDAEFVQSSIEDIPRARWFVVGPPAMVASAKSVLTELGVKDSHISMEDFSGY